MNATTGMNPIWAVVGRVLLGLLFLVYGVIKITSIAGTSGYMAKQGLPAPELFAWAAALIELIGGALIIVGWQTRRVAWALAVYTLVATGIGHRFWEFDGEVRMLQMANFMKNIMIVGAFCLLYVAGGGPCSIDRWWRDRNVRNDY